LSADVDHLFGFDGPGCADGRDHVTAFDRRGAELRRLTGAAAEIPRRAGAGDPKANQYDQQIFHQAIHV